MNKFKIHEKFKYMNKITDTWTSSQIHEQVHRYEYVHRYMNKFTDMNMFTDKWTSSQIHEQVHRYMNNFTDMNMFTDKWTSSQIKKSFNSVRFKPTLPNKKFDCYNFIKVEN
jgi:hypothetical protein